MLFNKNDFKEFQHMRLGDFIYFNQNIFITEKMYPNNIIYENIVCKKSFFAVTCLTTYGLLKKKLKPGLSIDIKDLSMVVIMAFFNYNILTRSFKDQYPTDIIPKPNHKFTNLMNSIVDPMYILKKDYFILLGVSIFCLPFTNIKQETSKDHEKKDKTEIKQRVEEGKFL